tara:strand:+ start:829 stop:1029 length:201 start_codon:yes stop_codon:yes gene_type:complete
MIEPHSSLLWRFDFIPVKTLCHGTHRIKDVPLNASNDTVFQLIAEEISFKYFEKNIPLDCKKNIKT